MPDAPAQRLADGVWRIPALPFDFVNTFALVDDDGQVTLVDTGVKSTPPRVLAGLAAMGKAPTDVTRIVLTHAHGDHAGGAADLRARTGAPVAIHEVDAAWARRGEAPPRDPRTLMGRLLNRAGSRANGFPAVEIGEELSDGQVLPIAGGLRVVHTPGHTPGHVSLLHEPSGVLITGDAIWNLRKLRWSVRAFCSDIRLNAETAHVLGELDYTVAAFTHGKPVRERAREQVRSFLRAARDAG